MDLEPDEERGPRELRLEGLTLMIAGGVLAALLFGAFQLGRAVERWNAPARPSAGASGASGGDAEAVDATEKLTFFDTLSGQGKEAEPSRQASKAATPPPAAPPAAVTPGPWFVQVFVGRDRGAAEEVVKTLRAKGYPVRTDMVAEGASGSLYKVRVGGFATKEAADAGATRLRQDGQASTWVVRLGG